MKKTILSISLVALTAVSAMFITSCSKDDTAPVITLLGDDPATVSLNGTYIDGGATANDDKDGVVPATVSSSDVNEDLVGTYTVTYTATDKEGNEGTANRTVTVVNDAAYLEGSYQGNETDLSGPYTYVQQNVVTASTTVNNQISMTRLGDFANNTVYMNVTGSTISLPSQTHTNVGTGTNSCDVHDRRSDGVGSIVTGGFGLLYNDQKLAPCSGSRSGVQAAFVKQ
ncbi:MAG: immunoglobulin-like domain-containing protein [Bacteroidia bacterium]